MTQHQIHETQNKLGAFGLFLLIVLVASALWLVCSNSSILSMSYYVPHCVVGDQKVTKVYVAIVHPDRLYDAEEGAEGGCAVQVGAKAGTVPIYLRANSDEVARLDSSGNISPTRWVVPPAVLIHFSLINVLWMNSHWLVLIAYASSTIYVLANLMNLMTGYDLQTALSQGRRGWGRRTLRVNIVLYWPVITLVLTLVGLYHGPSVIEFLNSVYETSSNSPVIALTPGVYFVILCALVIPAALFVLLGAVAQLLRWLKNVD